MKYIFLILFVSCASASDVAMENRTYDLCVNEKSEPTFDGFCYQDKVCTKKFLGICTKREIKNIDKIEIEFKDKVKAKQLFDMNFILKVRQKPF